MRHEQTHWTPQGGWSPHPPGGLGADADLVLVFGSNACLADGEHLATLRNAYPRALLTGCSSAGEICGTRVYDDTLVVTAIAFEHSTVQGAHTKVSGARDSYHCGRRLAQAIPHEGLRHVFVLSDGLQVNGTRLVAGLTENLPPHISVTGGLSGDGARFEETRVVWNGQAQSQTVSLIGFYGERLRVGYGSLGGWDAFGPERLITRAEGNVLYEMDGKSALGLYKQYLGEHAEGLPASGLLFPLRLRSQDDERGVARTLLSVSEEEQSLTFAGDVPVGNYARLMKANVNRLVDGAIAAARASQQVGDPLPAELAILISCVGRRLVLKQRVEEEVEGVREVLGEQAALSGFYSYGEIAPYEPGAKCELHNQTMTITTLAED